MAYLQAGSHPPSSLFGTQAAMDEKKLPIHVAITAQSSGSSSENLGASPPERLKAHLPATFRTKYDHISIPNFDDPEFLRRELLVPRLDDVQEHLWLVGRPMPPRPLHYQLMLSRNIVITESMELHLVWSGSRIFVKPMPSYLLDSEFWTTYLSAPEEMDIQKRQEREELAKSARGFLFTYTALIAYQSDFHIAQDTGLIAKTTTWNHWKAFTHHFLHDFQYSSVSPRFWYGELRLSRLNSIYRWKKGLLWRGYSKIASHMTYADLMRDHFHLLAAVLGYVVIVLTAMQVGLATDRLVDNKSFQDVSYGVSVLAIIAPLIVGVAIFGIVLVIIVYNWLVTKAYEKRRFKKMGLLPDNWGGRDAEGGQ